MAIDIRPTVRRRISRLSSYAVFLAFVVLLIFAINWENFRKVFFNLDIARELFPGIFRAAFNTIWYTILCFAVGLFFAVVFALMKMSKGPFRYFAIAFIELFRGLPALLTIFIMAFAIPIAFRGLRFPGGTIGAGLIGLIFVTTAYTAEIIRAGIVAVPKGQTEAARSLGMSSLRTTITVVLPQAFRIVIPPLTNEVVLLLKDTSLLYIAGATVLSKELTMFATQANATYFNSTPLTIV